MYRCPKHRWARGRRLRWTTRCRWTAWAPCPRFVPTPAQHSLSPSPPPPHPLCKSQAKEQCCKLWDHFMGTQQLWQAFVEVFVCNVYVFQKHQADLKRGTCHRCSNPQQSVEEHLLSLQYINLLFLHENMFLFFRKAKIYLVSLDSLCQPREKNRVNTLNITC